MNWISFALGFGPAIVAAGVVFLICAAHDLIASNKNGGI